LCNLGGELSQMHQKWGVKSLVAKGNDLGWVLALPSSTDWVFLPWSQNWWISEVTVFVQSRWGIITNASKMRCEKFGCKRNWSWLGFGFAKVGGLGFFALVAKLVNKWSYGFCAILVGNCHKRIKSEVWKVWLQKEMILVGFWLCEVRRIGFFAWVAKLVNKWSFGFCAI